MDSISVNPLVSIIIPVYNAEKYIGQCLQSILNQSYSNIELILAYDLKTSDNTLSIIKKYLMSSEKIILDSAYDKSSGDARNRGFKLAKGEFVAFIDADDMVLPTYVSDLISILISHTNLDVVCCNVMSCSNSCISQPEIINQKNTETLNIYDNHRAFQSKLWALKGGFRFPDAAWAWMIRREFLVINNISFPSYSYGEDALFTYKLVLYSNTVGVCNKKLYLYRNNTYDSASLRRKKYYWELYSESWEDRSELIQRLHPEYLIDFQQYQLYEYIKYLCKFNIQYYLSEIKKQHISKINVDSKPLNIYSRSVIILFNSSKILCYFANRYSNILVSLIR